MAIFTVTTLADENDPGATVANPGGTGLSLREAISLANGLGGADTIGFAAGLAGGTVRLGSVLNATGALTINGDTDGDNIADITISGDAANDDVVAGGLTDIAASTTAGTLGDNVQILTASANLTLDSLTLTGGVSSGEGGAVGIATSTSLTVAHSTISGNHAGNGGGISARDIAMSDTTVSGNTADNAGGGIRAQGSVTLTATTVSGNTGGFSGGGIEVVGSLALLSSAVSGNYAAAFGGGVNADTVTVTDSTVSGNGTHLGGTVFDSSYGGGINAGTVSLINATVSENSAGYGGGIYSNGSATVTNSTISGNASDLAGGGIYGSTVTLTNATISDNSTISSYPNYFANGGGVQAANFISVNSTITGNRASHDGGGVVASNSASLTNSILLGNSSGTGLAELSFLGFSVPLTAHGLNIVGIGADTNGSDGIVNAASVAAVFASIDGLTGGGLLAYNGGPVWTVELAYSLLNPALDSGTDSLAPATDARGLDRTIDQIFVPNTGANTSDLGATELQGQSGGNGADQLQGGDGVDVLSGGPGADTLTGGRGNDVYLNPFGDFIVELPGPANGAHDIVYSNTSFSLATAANVEDLTLTGTANINAIGNGLANRLTGNSGNNILNGGNGNDTLTGLGGADTLNGGAGDDIYVNPETIDSIVEAAGAAGGLHDRIQTLTGFNLANAANVEDITLVGGNAVNAIGNNAANRLVGNAGANILNGGGGADAITGGAGNDTMNGGTGADVFRFAAAGTGNDTIAGFETALDRFNLSGGFFSNRVEGGGNTTLTHAGGTILVTGLVGLSVTQWNALVDNSARTASAPHDDAAAYLALTPLHATHFGPAGAMDFL